MLKFIPILFCLFLISCNKKDESQKGPKAAKLPQEIKLANGITITEDYAWMRDASWPESLKDTKVLDHLNTEAKNLETFLDSVKDNKEKLFTELKSRVKLNDRSEYIKRDDYYYYQRFEEGKNHPIYCRKRWTLESKEEVLLDVNALASGKSYVKIGAFEVSPTHNLLAYTADFVGDGKYALKVLDLEKKEYLPDAIDNVANAVVWHKTLNGFLYLALGKDLRRDTVLYHEIGSKEADKSILHEADKLYYMGLRQSSSGAYAIAKSGNYNEREEYIISLTENSLEARIVKKKQPGITYISEHNGDFIYALINDTGPKMRLVRTAVADLENNAWKEYIPMDAEKYLNSFTLTSDYLLLNYLTDGLPSIKILHIKDSTAKIISFLDESYIANAYSTNYVENDIRVNYTSLIKPHTIYSYDFDKAKLTVIKQEEVLAGYRPEDYELKKIWANNNGVGVPISLFYKRDLFKQDGSSPALVTAYGAYGKSTKPFFSSNVISLVNRGFVYAIAHVRGGDELGKDWHTQAIVQNKKISFEDFVKCTEFLMSEKYTSSGNVAIMGNGPGGTLVAVAANNHPELYKLVIANYPSLDLLQSILDSKLPFKGMWHREFGDPNGRADYEYIKSYSPYDNVKKQPYPNVITTIGLANMEAPYWEGLKWAAKLRDFSTNPTTIAVKSVPDSGMLDTPDTVKNLQDAAELYTFIFKIFEIDPYAEEKKAAADAKKAGNHGG